MLCLLTNRDASGLVLMSLNGALVVQRFSRRSRGTGGKNWGYIAISGNLVGHEERRVNGSIGLQQARPVRLAIVVCPEDLVHHACGQRVGIKFDLWGPCWILIDVNLQLNTHELNPPNSGLFHRMTRFTSETYIDLPGHLP